MCFNEQLTVYSLQSAGCFHSACKGKKLLFYTINPHKSGNWQSVDLLPSDGSGVEDISRKCSLRKNETRPIREPESSAASHHFTQKTTFPWRDNAAHTEAKTQIFWIWSMQEGHTYRNVKNHREHVREERILVLEKNVKHRWKNVMMQ